MKQYIILSSLILLGVFISGLIIGPGDDSILSSIADSFRDEIDRM